MADIDVGPGATDRASDSYTGGYTNLCKDNPLNASGTINSLEIWAFAEMGGVKVGTFYEVSAGVYRCRSAVTIGTVTAGSKQTFVVDLTGVTGDILGFYAATGAIERDATGGGAWYYHADTCVAEDEHTYTTSATATYSIYATGDFAASIICVTNVATLITADGATLNGAATGLSASEWATERGFNYDVDSGTPYAGNWHEHGVWDADMDWTHALTGFYPGVPEYFQAYIITATS
jgi:hypothetical protein